MLLLNLIMPEKFATFDYLNMTPECSNLITNNLNNTAFTFENNNFKINKVDSISSLESMDQVCV